MRTMIELADELERLPSYTVDGYNREVVWVTEELLREYEKVLTSQLRLEDRNWPSGSNLLWRGKLLVIEGTELADYKYEVTFRWTQPRTIGERQPEFVFQAAWYKTVEEFGLPNLEFEAKYVQ